MTQALTISYKTMHRYKERIFAVLVVSIIFSAVAYAFLLERAIINVVDREKIVDAVSAKSTAVGDLETKYFALENNITLDLAHAKGFKDATVASYITKKPQTAMASNNEL